MKNLLRKRLVTKRLLRKKMVPQALLTSCTNLKHQRKLAAKISSREETRKVISRRKTVILQRTSIKRLLHEAHIQTGIKAKMVRRKKRKDPTKVKAKRLRKKKEMLMAT
jgi:hypothetical protein